MNKFLRGTMNIVTKTTALAMVLTVLNIVL